MKKITKQIVASLNNPIIRNHIVYGQSILPGLAYIDLIYQVFKEQGYAPANLQLRRLSMHHPLAPEENAPVLLTVQCTPEENMWLIVIEGEAQGKKKLHVTAEMHPFAPISFDETLAIEHALQTAERVTDISDAYAQCCRQELVHEGFMKLKGRLYHSQDALLMDLSVGPEALPTAERFIFHPALIDGSGVGSNTLLYSLLNGELRLFVPLFYESFSASEYVQTGCWARILTSSLRLERELIYMTIEFFNPTGKKVAVLKNFISKIVRQADLINPGRKSEAATPMPMVSAASHQVADNPMERYLCQLLAEHLKKPIDHIDTRTGYYDMGIDSPGLLKMVETINTKLGTSLPPTLLFEYPTIAELAAHLTENHAAQPEVLEAVPQPMGKGDVAIIGMAGRYPCAENLDALWKNLKEGKDCITEIPPSRWDWRSLERIKSPSGKSISKWGGFIDDPDCFDPQFFKISPREAETLDPQERLFLEVCWETIEDAGYTPKTLTQPQGRHQRAPVGVFVGVMHKDYALVGAEAVAKGNAFPLSLNYAPIANRVSYVCNFHGPSLAVDTVCSSSLTAIHLAIESIRLGECTVALAGGVNLSLHPHKYLTYGGADMFSSDGHCRTFGKGGDGYVSAEGVGAVLLKPLQQAIDDGDRIYAVIKGSAINHVGAVSGITVPSPTAQADIIEQCQEKAGIDPRSISYIEAHGTGTSLGDPIEIQGLVKAFRRCTPDTQFCAIGSVKSNLGHAESAAGILGLTKVALQLYHRTLVPSLHSEELNPYLDLPHTPFYVQRTTEVWHSPTVRRAGVSSFGATGSNAHLILEEYLSHTPPQQWAARPVIVPLSAKNRVRLIAYAQKLLAFLQDGIDLAEVAYTLQVGREAMEERVAFEVHEMGELMTKLEDFAAGKEGIAGCWSGRATSSTGRSSAGQIGKLWVEGAVTDWKSLYGAVKPRRISLPTYPFAKERYWVPQSTRQLTQTAYLHPLLHQNSSDLSEQRFTSTFTGKEFFFAGHVVRGKKVLPGVAHWEMVRAAVEKAVKEPPAITLKEIVWMRPLAIEQDPVTVHIGLFPESEDEIAFEIYGERTYSQGKIELGPLKEPPSWDLEQLKRECEHHLFLRERCYEAFQGIGLNYGPDFQGVEKIYVGKDQLVARISLPPSVETDFILHPCLLDSALQASMALKMTPEGILSDQKLSLPFAVERVVIYEKCHAAMWAYVRSRGDQVDIDVCDEKGRVCVQIVGLSSREVSSEIKTLYFEPSWEEKKSDASPQAIAQRQVIVCKGDNALAQGERVFQEIQALLKERREGDVLLQVVTDSPLLGSVTGLLKTAHLENPLFRGQLIEGDSRDAERENSLEPHVRYQEGRRYVPAWKERGSLEAPLPWKEGGIYLITGGLGGLGQLFAEEIVKRAPGATLILTGRSPLDERKKRQSSKVVYKQLDVTKKEEVERLIGEIGPLNGILHSAGIIRDNFIIKKSLEEFRSVLEPKVAGTIYLDEASRHCPLDFFVLFSSGTGAVGNVGQADYAMANAFMNAYADYRTLQGHPGKSVSILWPLWKEGGMRVDPQTEALMRERSGMVAMPTEHGIQAFYQALASDRSQVLVVEGDSKKVKAFLTSPKSAPSENISTNTVTIPPEKAEEYFKRILSGILKLSENRIDAAEPMEKYGIDSIMILQMTNQLEKVFGTLSKTLFFEYQNIRDLTGYFLKAHAARLADEIGLEKNNLPSIPMQRPIPERRPRFVQIEVNRSVDIAIIGMSGKYPQAENLSVFWKNLKEGKDCITEIPKERWDHDLYFDEVKGKPGKTYGKWGGFIDDVDAFDPLFFHISPKEAELMDPQERLFLQCAYETLEDAGYTREVKGPVGVYVGVMYEEYQLYGAQEQARGRGIALTGNPASIANRVSYFFNFRGPSLALDTMCSSSLTALHLACDSLKQGRCSLAIAGGVNLSVHPNKYLMLGQGRFISSKGRCESFGVGGDGYVPGEGVGAVLLKPLSQAIADRDHIYGIVKGTAINHGGRTNGYSVPNPHAQAEVIQHALKEAKIDARGVSYIEAHGTGTALGDPIEITGLSKAFAESAPKLQFCAIGSAKSNIGHCESAAGIAGLTKVLLQMKYQELAPSLHAQELNPHIDFSQTPFYVQRSLTAWNRPVVDSKEFPRIAGISSFGAGGANAHVVVEEYCPPDEAPLENVPAFVVLSAHSAEQLKQQADRLLQALEDPIYSDKDLLSIAYTLQVGREAMEERLALFVHNLSELKEKLAAFLADQGPVDGLFKGEGKFDPESLDVEDVRSLVEVWVQKRKYGKLLKSWVKGVAIDWNRLYGAIKPRRISLPTYPFAKNKYWINLSATSLPEKRNRYFLHKEWELSPLPAKKEEVRSVIILSNHETAQLAREIALYFPHHYIVDDLSLPIMEADGVIDLIGCSSSSEHSLEWIRWLQQLIERKNRLRLLGVTRGLESFQSPTVNMAGATRAGLYRMLQSEYSHLSSRHVDFDICLADPICAELLAESSDPEVCYRNGNRYRAVLQQMKAQPSRRRPFPEGHVLLITGGTRGLGYLCARHFVQEYGVKRLVLTGRESLPLSGQKASAIRELEARGVSVQVFSLSLSDEKAVEAMLQTVHQKMGPVGGVIHCAGSAGGKNPAFIKKSLDEIEGVLEPKTTGLDTLYQALQSDPLAFFLLFSSVSAAMPSLAAGQSDYAMANASMDYFAQAHKITSIQWPSWKETGMGEVKSKAYERTGLLSLTDAEGLLFLDEILAQKDSAVLLPAVRGDQETPPAVETQTWLIDVFSKELKIDRAQLQLDKPFQEYGIDSIILAQIVQQINQTFGGNLDPSVAYEYPSLRALGAKLSGLAPLPPQPTFVVRQEQPTDGDGIAVVGMSCRFAGAEDVEAYWDLLLQGRSAIQRVPPQRWGHASPFFAGMLDTVQPVDPPFFQIADEDARAMDPQAWAVLEECLKLMCRAGYTQNDVKGKAIGVYIGGRSQHTPDAARLFQMRNPILALGQNYLAANVSQFFDFHGPSVVIDTACSSALVSMNMAVQALRAGEIEAAVVGGVSLLLTEGAHRLFEQRHILSPEPAFHVFDKRANGIVLGEGVGCVLLKRVKQALADGDRIDALIQGIAINNDGKTVGPATPSFEAQKAVMQEALLKSGKRPEEIHYLEANGSGSMITDLLELKAVQSVYRSSSTLPLHVGSIKPNIGHPLCAEGIASFIKAVLVLAHRQWVPFLSGQQPLAHFDTEAARIRFSHEKEVWQDIHPAAAINCFADGGTNAHVIIEGWVEKGERNTRAPLPFPLQRKGKKSMFWKMGGKP